MKVVRIAMCVLLCVTVLSCSLSVFAVEPTAEPSFSPEDDINNGEGRVKEYLMSYYIWLCLRAWGIDISYNDSTEWANSVGDLIWGWVVEYLASLPSSYTVSTWIAPWQASYDYWGNLQGNSSMLDDIQDFADWLLDKFGLTDNQQVVVNPTYNLGGYTLYELNRWYYCDRYYGDPNPDYVYIGANVYNGTDLPQYYFVWSNGYTIKFVYISLTTYSCSIQVKAVSDLQSDPDHYLATSYGCEPVAALSTGQFYASTGDSVQNYYPADANVYVDSYNNLKQFMANATLIAVGDTKIITANIDLPADNPSYTDGDSIKIVDGEPIYIVIQWSDEVTIANLPAIVSTGGVSNPGLIELWRPVAGFIEDMGRSMSTVIGIVYEFPEEVITPIYVVTGLIILLGMIKIMREH